MHVLYPDSMTIWISLGQVSSGLQEFEMYISTATYY